VSGHQLDKPLRIIVLGTIVRYPLGGMAWHYLQYVMGLIRLRHDVYFVEDSDDYPSCYHPDTYLLDTDPVTGFDLPKIPLTKLAWVIVGLITTPMLHAGSGPALHASEICARPRTWC
jgi:hypothetical protein